MSTEDEVFSGTGEVQAGHRFDTAALQRHLEQHVAGGMAVDIVGFLEAVEVDAENGEAPAVFRRFGDRVGEARIEAARFGKSVSVS